MGLEENFSWEFLKNVADALDSYRIRALIDAKQDILNAGIYDESEYESILYTMLDEEKLKYSLYNFLKNNSEGNLELLNKFSQINSIKLDKTLKRRKIPTSACALPRRWESRQGRTDCATREGHCPLKGTPAV